ncbi:M48 family metalloprotease [Balneolaceae bacterium YR4-1]|uniref:M48 family metalloprotease n=1 Tax=Halalkalibaculum roseum TaxID=2709311 RepID=A0A6M1SKW7_9BACT|nr:M48 family metalloprotease [Halalkalibaculum roseum]NGP75649.1 M48 family metalloprotease [Halalkalibaculum roseum]
MRSIISHCCLLFILGLLVSACSIQESAISGERRAYGYSWDQEKKIGKDADQQIQQQFGLYDSDELQAYVDKIGQEMLAVSHMNRPDTPAEYEGTDFYFRVLDSPVVNAFALPGGYIYVTRGLLSHLDNEAQLSVVLGHEIGHVIARHASQRAFEQQMGQLALIGGAIGGELLGLPGGDILGIGSQAAQMLFLSYSREDERESDRLGVEYSSMQHYKAAEGAQFFVSLERMSKQSGQSIPDWQSTHPDPAERAKSIPELAEQWRAKGYEQTIDNTDQYMGKLNNMIYGENPREGFTRNGFFYHPEMRFQFPYPDGWQVINQRSLVAVVNRDQDAVSIMTLDGKSAGAEASVNEFLNQEGITTLGKSNAESNGLAAFRAEATGQAEDGPKLTFYVYAIEYGGSIYRFLNYTTAEKYGTYASRFNEITGGFKKLTDSGILNIQPVLLQTVKASRAGTFKSFLPTNFESLSITVSPEDLAIMNQVGLDEQIITGTWLKLPRQ